MKLLMVERGLLQAISHDHENVHMTLTQPTNVPFSLFWNETWLLYLMPSLTLSNTSLAVASAMNYGRKWLNSRSLPMASFFSWRLSSPSYETVPLRGDSHYRVRRSSLRSVTGCFLIYNYLSGKSYKKKVKL